jgi:hypothetical protein
VQGYLQIDPRATPGRRVDGEPVDRQLHLRRHRGIRSITPEADFQGRIAGDRAKLASSAENTPSSKRASRCVREMFRTSPISPTVLNRSINAPTPKPALNADRL